MTGTGRVMTCPAAEPFANRTLVGGIANVDRFFSKLDLRDIKIDPFKTSFPPDADDAEQADAGEADQIAEPPADEARRKDDAAGDWNRPARQPHVPAWAGTDPTAPIVNGHAAPIPAVGDASEGPEFDAPSVEQSGEVLKVSARSRPSAVAGAIAGVVREVGRAEVQAIGAGATNQAVKAVAIARDYLRETGIEAVCLPAFIDVTIENEDRTAIRLVVEPR